MTVLIKLSKRTAREGCRTCGRTGLYYFRDATTGNSVQVEANDVSRALSSGESIDSERLTLHRMSGKCRDANGNAPAASESSASVPADSDRPSPFGSKPPAPYGTDSEEQTANRQGGAETPIPAAVPAATLPVPPGAGADLMAALQVLMSAMAPKVDAAEVEAIVKRELAGVVFPTRVVVEKPNGERKEVDGAHARLSWVIKALSAKSHVMMVGPAGTGKSHIAESAADALGLEYGVISLSPTTPNSQILGYMSATGDYVRSLFRERYEHGGVFNFDEIDNSNPSTLAVINSGLSNGRMAFPDGMVKRHDDFRCVATANTYGRGADRQYVGRQQLDAATLDRFKIIDVPVDEVLEERLCLATGLGAARVTEVLAHTRKLRKSAEKQKMRVMISPRASIGICKDLFVEDTPEDWTMAVEGWVFKGMSDQDRSKLNGN